MPEDNELDLGLVEDDDAGPEASRSETKDEVNTLEAVIGTVGEGVLGPVLRTLTDVPVENSVLELVLVD